MVQHVQESRYMKLTPQTRRFIQRIVNTFETGIPEGRYEALVRQPDGPGGRVQISFGKSQATEHGGLGALLEAYCAAPGHQVSELAAYLPQIGRVALADDARFITLLMRAAQDPMMRVTQDAFFETAYLEPALAWARRQDFALPLSALVIYDSFIHSGSVLMFLRRRFAERPPGQGGDERAWIQAYLETRHDWLEGHRNRLVRNSAYRTRDMLREVARQNWDLEQWPVSANGFPVYPD